MPARIPQEKYFDPTRPGINLRQERSNVANGKPPNSFRVVKMQARHHEIARRLLLGQKGTEIAKALGVSAMNVSQVRNSPVVKEKLDLMCSVRDAGAIDLAKEIADLAPIALQRVKEVVQTGVACGRELSGRDILNAANSVLDRHIGKPTQTINTTNLNATLTLNDLDEIKARAAKYANPAVEVCINE